MLCIAAWITIGCGTVQKEVYSPAGTTNAPPIANQLNGAAAVVGAVVPQPWGAIVSTALGSLATLFASIAAMHAKNATGNAAAVVTTAAKAATTTGPPVKTS
jgi:hypothetical protein